MPRDRHASAGELPAPGHVDVTGMTPDSRYEIRVLGSLDPRWAAWFEGPQVTGDGSQTVLCGPLADQAALHGLLNKVCGLGLVLISVHRLDPD